MNVAIMDLFWVFGVVIFIELFCHCIIDCVKVSLYCNDIILLPIAFHTFFFFFSYYHILILHISQNAFIFSLESLCVEFSNLFREIKRSINHIADNPFNLVFLFLEQLFESWNLEISKSWTLNSRRDHSKTWLTGKNWLNDDQNVSISE